MSALEDIYRDVVGLPALRSRIHDRDVADLLGTPPRFIVFVSYGNDSIAVIQWAFEQGLEDVVAVYSDTG